MSQQSSVFIGNFQWMLLENFNSYFRQPMSQGIFIDLLKVSASKELVNLEAGLSNYVTEFIYIGRTKSI